MGYFANHRDRMCYSDYMQRGLPVGSGPVEAAAKTIIQASMKRRGMRWSHRGGQHILDLRAHLKCKRPVDPTWNLPHTGGRSRRCRDKASASEWLA